MGLDELRMMAQIVVMILEANPPCSYIHMGHVVLWAMQSEIYTRGTTQLLESL
jgi:hypothetical protein